MPLAAVDVNFYMYFFPKPVKCKRYPEAHWTDLIGFVCCGYWEKNDICIYAVCFKKSLV